MLNVGMNFLLFLKRGMMTETFENHCHKASVTLNQVREIGQSALQWILSRSGSLKGPSQNSISNLTHSFIAPVQDYVRINITVSFFYN